MKFIPCEGSDLISKIKNKRIICFGASQLAKDFFNEYKCENYVEFFVDNDKKKNDTLFNVNGKDFKIYLPEALKNLSSDNYVILITSSYYNEIWNQLEQIHELENMEGYIYNLLTFDSDKEKFYYKRLIKPVIKRYKEILIDRGKSIEEANELACEKERLMKEENKFIVEFMIFVLSNVCSLKCKNCSMLMPYFKKPHFEKLQDVLDEMELFLSAVDECIEINLIGGETLMYPDLDKVLEWLINNDKVFKISFSTNATIIPNERVLELLKNEKIVVCISDYGQLTKLAQLVEVFEKNGIRFWLRSDMKWIDAGGVEKRNKSNELLKFEYSNCFASKFCKAIASGKIFGCERAARMLALDAYKSDKDYFSLNKDDSIEELREKIKKIHMLDYMEACDYCDLGAFPSKEIDAGIQINENIKKSKYTIIDRKEYEKLINKR